ncbi:geranylgeranyl reductase family protein [Aquipuribacter sp. SD81]|uniref:geranylgeranyl reductase family protein n=1 Tax=Aquipuribacter sp. SD81 TaxID=3127703 RepID=UPI00301590FD
MDATGTWDVAVVGAGPAGSAAALAALRVRPGARVLLLDRADFPRDKACGDGVAPHVLDVLDSLGAPGLVDDHRPVRRLHLQVAPGPSGRPHERGAAAVARDMRRPARVVPRRVLDARIRAAALAAGAEARTGVVRAVSVGSRDVRLGLSGGDGLRARVVVGADGAGSAVRRALGLPGPPGRATGLAVRGYGPVRADLADEQRIVFDGTGPPAYAWSFPVGDGTANVGYGEVLVGGAAPSRRRYLERLEALLPGTTDGAGSWRGHHLPLSSDPVRQPDGRVLLAGDSLSLVNPLTGEGLYYAVLSGACAGSAAVAADGGDPGRAYRTMLRRRLGRHLRHTSALQRLVRVPGVLAAGVRAAGDPAVFDDLVEVGLGRGLLSARVALATGAALAGSSGTARPPHSPRP